MGGISCLGRIGGEGFSRLGLGAFAGEERRERQEDE
jgi:hypothetical protein